jgi:hypothetical protein
METMQVRSRTTARSFETHLSDLWLFELPTAAVSIVLQQLDQCSLASLAASCSKSWKAVPTLMSQLTVRCSRWETFGSFSSWLQQNRTNLDSVTQCSVVSMWTESSSFSYMSNVYPLFQPTPSASSLTLYFLPCPQLRQL